MESIVTFETAPLLKGTRPVMMKFIVETEVV